MPRTFSEKEREHIKKRLMEEASKCLAQYGVRKTTVDELVKRVGIPKGTFYLFYRSKELLFFDVLVQYHDEIHETLLSRLGSGEALTAEKLTDCIAELYRLAEQSALLRMMTDGELEYLIRSLPPEVAAEHARKDDFSVERLLAYLPVPQQRIQALSGALRGVFLTMLHRHEIGDGIFEDALRIMIRGVVLQMFEGDAL